MSRAVYVLGLLALWGCAEPATLDDACPASVPGDHLLSEAGRGFVETVSCWRRFVDLSSMRVSPPVQTVASSHSRYLEENGILDPDSPHFNPTWAGVFNQTRGLPLFTGVTVFDRLRRARAVDPSMSFGVWQAYMGEVGELDATEYLHSPYWRDTFFQPLLIGAGFSEFRVDGIDHAYFDLVFSFPANARIDRPVVFPRDGQQDVPTGYVPLLDPADPLSVAPVIGYPITITVGSHLGELRDENPYGLTILDVKLYALSDAAGEGDPVRRPVDTVIALPRRYPWGDLIGTLIVAPTRPLEPATSYEFEAYISWNARDEKRVHAVFTTASEPWVVGSEGS